jgi:hypothetical protein
VQSLLERDQSRQANFQGRLAEFHSRVMRHCLYLVARYYTEGRLLQIRGRFGTQNIEDFRGAHLMGQAQVTVMPGSLTPLTRESQTQIVLNYAQIGWIGPEQKDQAMAAIENGTGIESLIEDYELDYGKACRQIRAVEALENPIQNKFAQVPVADPMIDNPAIHLQVLRQYAKTEEAERLHPGAREALVNLIEMYKQMQQGQQLEQQQILSGQAQQLGMQNAGQPAAKPMPSLPSVTDPGR